MTNQQATHNDLFVLPEIFKSKISELVSLEISFNSSKDLILYADLYFLLVNIIHLTNLIFKRTATSTGVPPRITVKL